MVDHVRAHQRKIAEFLRTTAPRLRGTSLNGYTVETISKADATPLIQKYEWLGNIGRATLFVGLFSPSPERELQGAACFGHGPAGDIRKKIGAAYCLERGACVHYAPPNAASFLINRACKLIFRLTGVETFFAYGDPNAGEYGAVYQAAGWSYLGQGLDGGKGRKRRYFVLPPGLDRSNPANWKTTRVLRRTGNRMTWEQARAKGWEIADQDAKHVYAINFGPKRKSWQRAVDAKPYPAPRPDLKRNAPAQQELHVSG